MDTPNPIEGLMEQGFSEYEARSYVELLRSNPAGAYELSKKSGIPSSKIYQALARLVERGVAMSVEEAGKTRYVPLSPSELVAARRQRVEGQLDSLEKQLVLESRDQRMSYIWNINDYAALQDQVRLVLRDTRRELALSCWAMDLVGLETELLALRKRGGRIAIVLFGAGTLDPALERMVRVYHHPIEDTLYEERGGRSLTLVSDGNRALTATIFADQSVEGAWSLNHGFALLAEDYVKHDIYLMKIVKRMDQQLTERFGERYHLLRDIFEDQEL